MAALGGSSMIRLIERAQRPHCALQPRQRKRSPVVHGGALVAIAVHRSYESIRPSAPHRYSRLVASTTCASPFALKRLVPAVPIESLCQVHAPFTPVAAYPVLRSPAGSSQRFHSPLVLTTP